MSLITNGITADVIREMMPPYRLSADLLEATFAALPPPPANAPPDWRQLRVARLTQEFATLMPANAAQARIVSQILILRGLADAVAARAHAPELTPELMARVGRASAELARTATGLLRALERTQQKPVPFFGTVLADEVDLPALDAVWGTGTAGAGCVRPGGLGRELPVPARVAAINPTQLSAAPARAAGRPPAAPGGETVPETTPALPGVIASGACDPGDGREFGVAK